MNRERGRILLGLARAAIAEALGLPAPVVRIPDDATWLAEPGATFVTLTRDGQLRGCIGSLQAQRPLIEDVRANAVAAAFHDPRFPPLGADELERTDIEVSLLSPMQPFIVENEADAIRRLRPGVDGVVLEFGPHKGTFLPQVWEQLPDPATFLAHLKQKAGLPPDFWHPDVRLFTYEVEKFREREDDHGQ